MMNSPELITISPPREPDWTLGRDLGAICIVYLRAQPSVDHFHSNSSRFEQTQQLASNVRREGHDLLPSKCSPAPLAVRALDVLRFQKR